MSPGSEYNYLIDTHCHFDFPEFDEDREIIWQRCQQKNIKKLIIPGVNPKKLDKAISISEQYSGIYFSVGLHPWWIEKNNFIDANVFADAINHPKCIAIGECGLDKRIKTPISEQIHLLSLQLQIAFENKLPVIIHNVKANSEILSAIDKQPKELRGVIHAFSGSYELAMEFYRRGFLLGIGGTISYERAKKTREAVSKLPLDALILETDAPDMPVSGQQGKRNSPENLEVIIEILMQLRNEKGIKEKLTENSIRIFNLANNF